MKVIFLLLCIPVLANSQTIKVMSYNLRYDNPGDGINAWPNRKAKVISMIRKNTPDILGVQEGLKNQVTDLKVALADYHYVGVGRDDGKEKGEYSALFFNKKKYDCKSSGTFWLSETPEIPGSKSWDAAITRIATWAILIRKKTKDTILVVNTHFDHIGKLARENSANLLKDKIAAMAGALPVILTGDFNSEPSEVPYKLLTNGETFNLRDSGINNTQGTFCGFSVGGPCKRIDYIFYSVGLLLKSYTVVTQNNKKYYPSDHLPIVAEFKRGLSN